MTEKDIRKLKRQDMLEIMLAQSREIDRLRKLLSEAEAELAEKRIAKDKAGNLAEAALAVTKIFEDAQKAADLYLYNLKDRQEKEESKKAAD